jgi:DNA processing protein
MSDVRDWIALNLIPGVGPRSFLKLLSKFRSPDRILSAKESELAEVLGQNREIAQRIANYRDVVDIEKEMKLAEQYSATVITLEDPRYPVRLAEIYEPPILLYIRTELLERDKNSVAIVGTRRASMYGKEVAERLAGELAQRGITVVSGMAEGIDSAAHRGALKAGGRTLAVFGGGVDVVYPARNRRLMEQIMSSGCVISEFPMGCPTRGGNFPRRNRIISGLTLGTVVVEGDSHSGALITARYAAEQGREVFAVPGNVNSFRTDGPHSLIKDGAKLTETANDIIEEIEGHLEIEPEVEMAAAVEPSQHERPDLQLSEAETKILGTLSEEPLHIDGIADSCAVSAADTMSALTMLELKGLARQLPGKVFVRK